MNFFGYFPWVGRTRFWVLRDPAPKSGTLEIAMAARQIPCAALQNGVLPLDNFGRLYNKQNAVHLTGTKPAHSERTVGGPMKADAMIGRSEAFCSIAQLIAKIAAYDAPVLIEGETGTGKELAARSLHYHGLRRDGPFVPVNCGALPDQLIENELFGHRRGAFTDAREDQVGLVALANGGTLFLDEIDALTPRGQVTLLRFLQDQQFRPLGARREEQADVRIIAASNRRLDQQATAGVFRFDLLYRLNLMHVSLPPLRERHGDVAMLSSHFINVGSARFGKAPKPFDEATLEWFERYRWPGNIRELENLVYREFLLSEGARLSIAPPASLGVAERAATFSDLTLNHRRAKELAMIEFESRFLARVFGDANGNVSAAARLCGIERRHFGRLLRKYRIIKPSRETVCGEGGTQGAASQDNRTT